MTKTSRSAEIAAARAADEKIAAAWALYWEAKAPVDELAARAIDADKSARRYPRRAEEYAARAAELRERMSALYPAVEDARLAALRLDAELYKGWTRFFLVKHIHSSQSCSSFRPTTRVGWLPDVSGLTEAEAVAEHGAILCTICFPSAPVEWTEGPKDDRCPGSGRPIDRELPGRFGFYAGNWATCPECAKRVGVTRTGYRIPKHAPAAA